MVNWLKTAVQEGEWQGNTVFLDKNKKEIPCHIKITPTKDKNGEHIGYCGVTTPLNDKTPDEVRPKINLMTKIFTWLVIMRLPFLTATFVPLFAGAAVATILFLGGWLSPLEIYPFTLVPGPLWLVLKILLLFLLFALVKAIVPRYRYDQLMKLGWKIFLPLSLTWVVLTASYLLYFDLLPVN